ncbi:MAG: acyltransferase [Clostridiales bacterium]|nr:acyltransferase [Clostridiales bacterium]
MSRSIEVNRDQRLDVLRTIGLLCIILAHVSPPKAIFQMRNFDVPLMVLISGAAYCYSKSKETYLKYLIKRILRLVLPTWTFLSIYFVLFFFFAKIAGESYPYSIDQILKSYSLISGIGYVWVIRVFILCAMVIPIFSSLINKIKNVKWYLLLLVFLYVIYEFSYRYLGELNIQYANGILEYVVFYIFPYGCIAGFGLALHKLNRNTIVMAGILFLLIFLGMFCYYSMENGNIVWTQHYKYPARIYYISYALAVSLLLYLIIGLLLRENVFIKMINSKPFRFFSSFTIWIYLWHILYVNLWERILVERLPDKIHNFIIEYIFVLVFATITALLQKIIVSNIIISLGPRLKLKALLTEMFLK